MALANMPGRRKKRSVIRAFGAAMLGLATWRIFFREKDTITLADDSLILRHSNGGSGSSKLPEGTPSERQQQQHQEFPELQENTNTNNGNRIVYVGKFGLGHRLSKMAAAYHLAQRLQSETKLPLSMEVQWGVCDASGSG